MNIHNNKRKSKLCPYCNGGKDRRSSKSRGNKLQCARALKEKLECPKKTYFKNVSSNRRVVGYIWGIETI